MKIVIAAIAVMLLSLAGVRAYKSVIYNINCGERIERASRANTVKTAIQELEAATTYLEQNNLTSGYTSVLWKTPSEDVEFWYKNLKASLTELKSLPADASSLEKSNMLIKLRESLIKHSQEGDSIVAPSGISVHPHNFHWFVAWVTIASAVLIVAAIKINFLGLIKAIFEH